MPPSTPPAAPRGHSFRPPPKRKSAKVNRPYAAKRQRERYEALPLPKKLALVGGSARGKKQVESVQLSRDELEQRELERRAAEAHKAAAAAERRAAQSLRAQAEVLHAQAVEGRAGMAELGISLLEQGTRSYYGTGYKSKPKSWGRQIHRNTLHDTKFDAKRK